MGDLLYAFTEWLRTTQLPEFSLWISNTALSLWIGTHFWAIPILQVTHILAIAASFASVLMINARMFGIAGSAPMAETANRYIKVLWWALLVLILSGIGMIIGEPVRELVNPVFWVKMALVLLGIFAALAFHHAVLKHYATGRAILAVDRATGVFLIALWCVIMLCGRWIAYAPV